MGCASFEADLSGNGTLKLLTVITCYLHLLVPDSKKAPEKASCHKDIGLSVYVCIYWGWCCGTVSKAAA